MEEEAGAVGDAGSMRLCKDCNATAIAWGGAPCPLVAIAMATTSRHMAERVENPGKKVSR